MRHAGLEAQRLEGASPEIDAPRDVGAANVRQAHRLGADPGVLPCHERLGPAGHVLEQGLTAGEDCVVGEFVALDELLDAHLGDVLHGGEHVSDLVRGADDVRVRGPRAIDGLDDHRVPDPLDRALHLGGGARAVVMRRADACRVEARLHQLLVPERPRLLHTKPGHAEGLTHSRSEDDAWLPEALDPIEPGDPEAPEPGACRLHGGLLVPQVRNDVQRIDRVAHVRLHGSGRLVPDAEDADPRQRVEGLREVTVVRRERR